MNFHRMCVLGCYFHGHSCFMTQHQSGDKWEKMRAERQKRTEEKTKLLKTLGYEVVEMRECEFKNWIDSEYRLKAFIRQQKPPFYQMFPQSVTEEDILRAVKNQILFGMILVDIEVDEKDYGFWSEFSPLFCNSTVPFDAIGKTMQDFWNETHVQPDGSIAPFPEPRLLIGGMKCKEILLATELLQWYLEKGLRVTKIHQVLLHICNLLL